jgi:tripartite-type tricarboxylate transporter receptor subunit TctC
MDRMLSMRGNCRLWVAVASLVISQAPNRTAYAADEDVAAFYRGKTIRMVVGTSPGGGVDLIGRLVAKHLRDHIPGNPSIVVQNMPGAGGMQMTNNLFNTGARDGTVIGAPVNGVPTGPLLQPRAARFDPTKLLWIGSVYRSTNIAYAWHTAPVQSLDQWKTQELLIGTSGVGGGSYDVGVLTKDGLGLKTKLLRGYESTPQDRDGARRDPRPDRRLGEPQGAAPGVGA